MKKMKNQKGGEKIKRLVVATSLLFVTVTLAMAFGVAVTYANPSQNGLSKADSVASDRAPIKQCHECPDPWTCGFFPVCAGAQEMLSWGMSPAERVECFKMGC